MPILNEFKKFALRGNMIDLAIGVIIGASFSKVVSSLVSDMLMPPIGLVLGGVDFSQLSVTLKEATPTHAPVEIKYGLFANTIIDFLIVSIVIFLVVKFMNRVTAKLKLSSLALDLEEKKCDQCLMAVPRAAKKCCHCGSLL